jgi:hypothetical protein
MEKILTMCFKRYSIPNELIWNILYNYKGLQHPLSNIILDSLYSGQYFVKKYISKKKYLEMFIKCSDCNKILSYNVNVCILVNSKDIKWYLPINSIKSSDDSFTRFIYYKYYPSEEKIYYTYLNKILKENISIICQNCDNKFGN